MRRLLLLSLSVFLCFMTLPAFGEVPPFGQAPLVEPGFDIAAKAALLLEPESNTLLYAKDIHRRLPPASLTKIVSMLLIMEAVDEGRVRLDEPVTTSAHAAGIGGSQVYLKEGEVFPLEKLLIAIAVESANDATTAVAEHLYSTEEDFVRMMNLRARKLGMKNSHFTNPHGLPDPEHYTSAADIAVAARELIVKHPRILRYTSIWQYEFRPEKTVLLNTNELIRDYRGADGLKTGHTQEAGWCLVGTARRAEMRLIAVVMGAADNAARLRETKRLLDYGFRNFEVLTVAQKGQELGRVRVPEAWPSRVKVTAPQKIVAVVPRGKARLAETKLTPHPGLRVPVAKGEPLADLTVFYRGKKVSRQIIPAARPIGRANIIIRGWRAFIRWVLGLFR
ncbi:MAG: D-alanyl-D-alanine carboxypeptidase [Firmicutes bacterium]|nr:D-alanyl-D-alanine carboxypeptidase [Bacillota bacterium]